MLYLIRSFGRDGKKAMKVGYTDDLSSRFLNYKIHNPYFEILATREGDERDEMKVQLFLQSFGFKADFLNEWFEDRPEITTLFHETKNKIHKRIWRYRSFLFTESNFLATGNKRKREIYEELRMIMGINKELPIDIAWKRESNKKILKQMRNNDDLYFLL